MRIYGDEKKAFELMAEYNNRAKDIFDSIKPFISKEKINWKSNMLTYKKKCLLSKLKA